MTPESALYDWWIEHFRCDFLVAKLNGELWAQGEWEEHAGHRAQAKAHVEAQMAVLWPNSTVEYGVRIDGDVIRFPGHTLDRYKLLAHKNGGQVVARLMSGWWDYEGDMT